MGQEPFDLWSEFQIARVVELKQAEFFLDMNLLPRQYITGDVKLPGAITQPLRCKILDRGVVAEGRSGIIRRIQRTPAVGAQAVCVKIPKNPQQSLCPEALVQALCARTLQAAGVVGAVPAVYDIYRFADETRFSMEYVEGKSAIDAVLISPSPDTTWLQILAQAALILGYLEEHLHLDHRDLKADNLWIRPRAVSYSLKVGGVQWQVSAPFQVVFLDFGFSCIGGADGNALVSLTDGVIPLIDPCPKEGRDLFQLIGSMWSVPQVRERASPDIAADMELLLKHRAASYIDLVRKTIQSTWIYMAVSDLKFHHPVLHPISLLERLAHEWYPTAGVVIAPPSRPHSARTTSRPTSAAPSLH
jgi:serine/threonine protein kinase